jgi:tripartite-type tricarboxylate transporter receptor subunit TctC
VQVMFSLTSSSIEYVRAGKLRPLEHFPKRLNRGIHIP